MKGVTNPNQRLTKLCSHGHLFLRTNFNANSKLFDRATERLDRTRSIYMMALTPAYRN